MERSISHTLLLDNKIYLQAVQHKRISLENLGLHEVQYSFGSTRNTTGRRVLKAVIPENNQIEFLQKVGLVESPVRPSSASKVKETVEKPRIRKKRNHDEEHNHRHNKNHLMSKSEKGRPKSADPLSGTHLVRRTSIGGTPLYAKPSQTFVSILEREREEAIARTKAKEHAAKLGVNFDMVDREGVKYVYDNRGMKVTEEEYQKQLDEAERAKKRRSEDRIIPPHKTALIEKTKRFVEDLRKRIESETILDFRWYPGKFPATTLLPRPGSANGPNSNSLRDISTLGKSVSTPFRKGEPHVLPSNLVRQWPEYRVMEPGDVVLTVEHCCQCHEHDMCTHHKEEQYLQMAESVRENLAATARKYAVRFYSVCKPVEFEDPLSKSLSQSERIVSGQSSHHQPKSGDNAAFNIDYSQRLGAFEVQVAVRTKKDFICHLLFSKLFKGNWPKMSTLQSLLERVLTEAKFFQLVKDPPRSPSRPTSRPGSPKRVPLYKPPKKDEKEPEIHAEFDLRLPAADTDEEEPVNEEEETGEHDEDTYSLPPPLSRESSTRLLTIPENSDIDTAPKLGSPISPSRGSTKSTKSTKSPKGKPSSAKYSAEENAAASALARFMRAGKPNTTADSVPSSKRSSFSSEYSEDETPSATPSPIKSAKAKLLALGSASAGLQYVRRKSKHQDQAEGAGLISYEEAMAIANGTSTADKPGLYTKKQSAIGILSRQNAGAGGQGRYLVVEDEDESPMQSDQPARAFFPSPVPIQKTNSQTSIPFSAQPSPREHAALPLSPKRSTPHNKKGSFSTVSEDEEVIGFSPRSSQKSSRSGFRPVALAVEVTQAGMAFAKNRSSSVTSMPQTPTMVEMLHERQSTGKLSQSERIQGRPSPATRNTHNNHPSLEMRSKLNIGMLSRQNAGIRGESLVVADSDSDDESRPGDKPASVPPQRILDAMASAVSAVSLADTLTNTNAGTSTASSSTNTLALTGGSVTTPHLTPVVAPTATPAPASSSLADRRPSNITAIDTSHSAARRSRTEPKKDAPAPEAAPAATAPAVAPIVAAAVNASKPAAADPAAVPVMAVASTPIVSATAATAVNTPMPPTSGSVTALSTPVVITSTPVAPLPETDKAATAAPVSVAPSDPEPAPAITPVPARVVSAFAVQDSTHMGRRMSSAEVLQMKRGLADQLVLTVSRDILEPVPSEYADDFDDFENFSPSKKTGNGLDDLFEASDFKLDDEL